MPTQQQRRHGTQMTDEIAAVAFGSFAMTESGRVRCSGWQSGLCLCLVRAERGRVDSILRSLRH